MILDAHQHFWELSQPFDYRWLDAPPLRAIRKDFLPEILEPQLRAAGVDRSIFVQTQHNLAENRWVLGLAKQHPFIAGVVGWVDLASPDCERQLEEFLPDPRFLGVRHITQDEPDDDFILRPEVRRGLKVLEKHGVPFDLLFFVKHLPHAAKIAAEFPALPLVIDHLAKPRIKDRDFTRWTGPLREAARFPNVYCKLSGLVTEADWQCWQPADLRPYVEIALEAFGPARCMFGSDWPVCELAGSYRQVVDALRACIADLDPEAQAWILGRTAAQFYRLDRTP